MNKDDKSFYSDFTFNLMSKFIEGENPKEDTANSLVAAGLLDMPSAKKFAEKAYDKWVEAYTEKL